MYRSIRHYIAAKESSAEVVSESSRSCSKRFCIWWNISNENIPSPLWCSTRFYNFEGILLKNTFFFQTIVLLIQVLTHLTVYLIQSAHGLNVQSMAHTVYYSPWTQCGPKRGTTRGPTVSYQSSWKICLTKFLYVP